MSASEALIGLGETQGIQLFWKAPSKPFLGLGVAQEHQKPPWGPRAGPKAGEEEAGDTDPSQQG